MRFVLLILLLASACARFPALDDAITEEARAAPYPDLTELPSLDGADTDVASSDMTARLAALRARAAQLRQIDIAALQ